MHVARSRKYDSSKYRMPWPSRRPRPRCSPFTLLLRKHCISQLIIAQCLLHSVWSQHAINARKHQMRKNSTSSHKENDVAINIGCSMAHGKEREIQSRTCPHVRLQSLDPDLPCGASEQSRAARRPASSGKASQHTRTNFLGQRKNDIGALAPLPTRLRRPEDHSAVKQISVRLLGGPLLRRTAHCYTRLFLLPVRPLFLLLLQPLWPHQLRRTIRSRLERLQRQSPFLTTSGPTMNLPISSGIFIAMCAFR